MAKIDDITAALTLQEKALLVTGHDFWRTNAVERLGVPSIFLTDGPHGLRKASEGDFGTTTPATCFPTASGLASSWSKRLLREVGEAIGQEAIANDVQVVLGPGVNMKRSPLAGRNFEYFSEDPVLSGEMAAAFINGLQHTGVGASLKHFVANNQEFERMASDSIVDERTLHEVYLRAFEIAINKSQPWSVMSAYNKVNGTHVSENKLLLTNILRKRWGFKGIVVSDWGAVHDIVASIQSGLQLEMPGNPHSPQKIIDAINSGELTHEQLDAAVSQLLQSVFKVAEARKSDATYDKSAHHELARQAAAESIVLLKNKGNLLPITPSHNLKIAVIGQFAKTPRYQGAGSSQVNPTQLSPAYDELVKIYGEKAITFAKGYKDDGSTTDTLLAEADRIAHKAHVVLVFAGLPDQYESEGFDRSSLDLPDGHNQLISTIAKAKHETVVILMNGAAVTMPWEKQVPAIVEGWLGGQAGGQALADIISGAVNPSGKLSETFPAQLDDTPPYPDFPAKGKIAHYREGILTGYKYYEARGIAPLFPFGHGLSYTSFAYNALELSQTEMTDTDTIEVQFTLKNTGKWDGKEVVQLYVSDHTKKILHPPQELKAFQKIALKKGESTTVRFTLDRRCFTYFDPHSHDWRVDPGRFTISIGSSSAAIRLSADIIITIPQEHQPQLTRDSLLKEFAHHPRGKRFYELITAQARKQLGDSDALHSNLIQHVIDDLPLSKISMMSGGMVNDRLIDAIVLYCQHPGSWNPLYVLPLVKESFKLIVRQFVKRR